jgi:hypothetical protein
VVINGVPITSFKVIQEGEPYEFNLTLLINTNKGEITKILKIKKKNETFEIPSNGTPQELVFDGHYDLIRTLSEKESPHVIARLLGDKNKLIVIPEKDKEKYEDLINVFKGEGSILVLGSDSPILKRLFGGRKIPEPGFSFAIAENPLNTSKVRYSLRLL